MKEKEKQRLHFYYSLTLSGNDVQEKVAHSFKKIKEKQGLNDSNKSVDDLRQVKYYYFLSL